MITYKINKIDQKTLSDLYKKSIFNISNNPKDLTPNALKEAFAGIVLNNENSILAEQERIINEQNKINENIITRINEIGWGGNNSVLYVGDEQPPDGKYQVWIDTSGVEIDETQTIINQAVLMANDDIIVDLTQNNQTSNDIIIDLTLNKNK